MNSLALIKLGTKLPSVFFKIYEVLEPHLADGISGDEAEEIARSVDLGDLQVKVKGNDIVSDDAQLDLQAFVGRVVRDFVHALQS